MPVLSAQKHAARDESDEQAGDGPQSDEQSHGSGCQTSSKSFVELKKTHPSLVGLKMTHASLERVVDLKMTHPSLDGLKMTHPSLERVENDESFLSKSSSAFLKFPESFRIQKTKKGCQTSSKS